MSTKKLLKGCHYLLKILISAKKIWVDIWRVSTLGKKFVCHLSMSYKQGVIKLHKQSGYQVIK